MPAARARGGTTAKPRPDAYVGLLGLSLLALIVAIVFAYLNWDQIKEKPKAVQMSGGARLPAATAPGGAPGGTGAPPQGGMPPPALPPNAAPAPGVPGGNPPPAPVPPQKK